ARLQNPRAGFGRPYPRRQFGCCGYRRGRRSTPRAPHRKGRFGAGRPRHSSRAARHFLGATHSDCCRADHCRNAAWGASPNMLTLGRLDMEIEPGALLALKLVIPRLTLEEGSLLLETRMSGERNWAPFVAASGASHRRPQVQRLRIHDGTLRYHNGQTGAETKVAADDLVAEAADG